MDDKFNKVTYQKSRLFVLMFYTMIDYFYSGTQYLLFGPSDFELTVKKERSVLAFILLVAIVIFRQKYELQVLNKYRLDNLVFGKAFYLPMHFFVLTFVSYFIGGKFVPGLFVVNLIFLAAYTNFFWDKAMRTLGINRVINRE